MAQGGSSLRPLSLKLLLPASLVLLCVGVYRCSREMTPLEGPGSGAPERATVELPDSLATAPADSLAGAPGGEAGESSGGAEPEGH